MQLKRLSDAMHKWEDDFVEYGIRPNKDDPSEGTAHIDFRKVGSGTDNFSWFQVSLKWADVEALMEAFSKMGHPDARRLARARKLASAVEDLVGISN